jgi:5'-deoxynucleotidase
MNHFFAYLYRLRFIQRWSLMRNAVPESVAEHSFQVALLAHALCTIGRAVFGKDVPTERVVTPALLHRRRCRPRAAGVAVRRAP